MSKPATSPARIECFVSSPGAWRQRCDQPGRSAEFQRHKNCGKICLDSARRIGSVSCNLHGRLQSGWFSNLTLPSAPVAIQTPMGSFTSKLVTAGVEISMDGRGRFMDNIFIERLWRSIKYEEVHLKAYADGCEARSGISSWMTFYNFRRPHQAMNNQMPMAVWRAGMALRERKNQRRRREGCGYAASLGQRKRVAHIPT